MEEAAVNSQQVDKPLSLRRRLEIFRVLVEAQDGGMGVTQSLKTVAERYGLSESQVRRIIVEGLEGKWPPL
jgi:hypothetical protein